MATGDITAVRINASGWYAEVDIEGFVVGGTYDFGLGINNDPSSAKIVFTVVSEGYNAAGTLGTISRTVYAVKQLRKPYPNQADADESEAAGTLTVKVILSEFIYNDDKDGGAGTSGTNPTVNIGADFYTDDGSGGTNNGNNSVSAYAVTNNSTLDYPKVVGQWAWPGYGIVTSDFLLETVCFHKFAKDGKQVACVKFDASDQSAHSSAQQTITTMTLSSRDVLSEPRVVVYAATMDIDALDDTEVIDCNFVAYPWVGDADSTLDSRTTGDGVAQPEERLGPLHLTNNKSGGYGRSYALIDATSGNDASGVVYATQGAAESGTAYQTIDEAVKDLKAYNLSNYSRDETGGSVVLLTEDTHKFEGDSSHGALETWFIIKPISTATRANVILGDDGEIKDFDCVKLKIDEINLTASDNIAYYGGGDQLLWLHNCYLDVTGASGFIVWKVCYATDCEVENYVQHFLGYGADASPWKLIRGVVNNQTNVITGTLYCMIGNDCIQPAFQKTGNASGHQISDGGVFAFNTIYDTGLSSYFGGSTDITKGMAVVQNIMEATQGVEPILNIVSTTKDQNNILLFHNTFAGERNILAYAETATQEHWNWAQKHNIFEDWNNKGDIFSSDGTFIGNWMVKNMVGSVGNIMESAGFSPEFNGLFTVCCIADPDYINDKSQTGDGLGNGDYNLGANSDALDLVPSGEAVLPYDLGGAARYNNGSGAAGAYEYILGAIINQLQGANLGADLFNGTLL